ncbi:MAG: class I SAM-dependent methyltransferase [Actinomycetota bacterium]
MGVARRPGLRRSVRLFAAFRVEQTDPDRFYRTLAGDSVDLVGRHADVAGARVLDVGGGPGYFGDAFRAAGARYAAVESDAAELTARGAPGAGTVRGDALDLPVADAAVDVCFSSNVLEHVRDPWRMTAEMLRVTRPGGLVLVSFTTWWGPWGGHETSPWHYLGGRYARERYARRHGREPKNRYGESLFAVRVGPALRWAGRATGATLLAAYPRYHPWWAAWLVRVPLLREVLTWNLVLVLRRDEPCPSR